MLDKKDLRAGFINETLQVKTFSKKELDEMYQEVVKNTVVIPLSKEIAICDTSNVLTNPNENLLNLLPEEEKEKVTEGFTPNYEAENVTFLMGDYIPREGSLEDVSDRVNQTLCLSAIIPDNPAEVSKRFREINYLTAEDAVKILKDTGYSHLPLSKNAAQGLLNSKVGIGKSVNSILSIPDGKLKREFSSISVALSGGNIEHNNGGFFKSTYGLGAAYLTNYRNLYATDATKILEDSFHKAGFSDFHFTSGSLQNYLYRATFTSKKLGEALLKETGIFATNPLAIIVFQTSDYGLSSVNMTPYLQFDMTCGLMATDRTVTINISDMVKLAHDAKLDEEKKETMEDAWQKKCNEIFAIVKDNAQTLANADAIRISHPQQALDNLMAMLGVAANLEGKEELVNEFIDDYGITCSARDLFVFLYILLGTWEQSNLSAAIRAKEKLFRVLMNGTWKKYDKIS